MCDGRNAGEEVRNIISGADTKSTELGNGQFRRVREIIAADDLDFPGPPHPVQTRKLGRVNNIEVKVASKRII